MGRKRLIKFVHTVEITCSIIIINYLLVVFIKSSGKFHFHRHGGIEYLNLHHFSQPDVPLIDTTHPSRQSVAVLSR